MMIFCCEEHAEEGLEEVLENEGPPPDMKKIPADLPPQGVCFICEKKAVYQIKV